MNNYDIDTNEIESFLIDLQETISSDFNEFEKNKFLKDDWKKQSDEKLKGNGRTRIIENGSVFERAGINYSHVFGKNLPPSATSNRKELKGRSFEALGLSLVFHPYNPYIPTVHMNIRFFIAYPKKDSEDLVWWFGGGMDLTPYYIFEEDARHFHAVCKKALDCHSEKYYPKFKKNCDEYFFLKHRSETRGIGGIFFDDFSDSNFENSFSVIDSVGKSFAEAYFPIVNKRREIPFGDREKKFQAYRRGRYVEFNLVYDRGTIFGLQSGGRIESILMSMPPNANWVYDFKPEFGTDEQRLYEFLKPTNWLDI